MDLNTATKKIENKTNNKKFWLSVLKKITPFLVILSIIGGVFLIVFKTILTPKKKDGIVEDFINEINTIDNKNKDKLDQLDKKIEEIDKKRNEAIDNINNADVKELSRIIKKLKL